MKLLKYIGRCFVSGLLALLPLAVTVGLLIWASGFLLSFVGPDTIVGKVLAKMGLSVSGDSSIAYFMGWLMVFGFILLLGFVAERGARKYMQAKVGALIGRIPLIGSIYGTVKQLVDMVDKKDKTDLSGMSVILVVFGGEKGAAFLALLASPEILKLSGGEYRPVLIPSAPVPVGGSLIMVPAASVKPTDISVDTFMSIYVSMGVTAPQFLPTVQATG